MRLLVALFMLVSFACSSQKRIDWYPGLAVLANGQHIQSKFSIDLKTNLILVKEKRRAHVLPPFKVKELRLFADSDSVVRQFISLPCDVCRYKNENFLYELMLDGPIRVVRRPDKETTIFISNMDNFNYYVSYEDAFIPLRHFPKKIFGRIAEELGPDMRTFVRKHRLDPGNNYHAVRIIQFYNSYQQAEASLD